MDKLTCPKRIEDLDWFHGKIGRHIAEVLLLGNGEEGSYLVRNCDSHPNHYSVSVKGKYTVKHFELAKDGEMYTFGSTEFDSFDHLLVHFANQPLLGGVFGQMFDNYDKGTMVTLLHPYPKFVEEPETTDEILMHSTMLTNTSPKNLLDRSFAQPVASKSGYLTKQGGKVKTWKYRWIVLIRNEFSYYEEKHSERPINTISLRNCRGCEDCGEIAGNNFCFQLLLPERTWCFSASSEAEKASWVNLIKWKLKRNAKNFKDLNK